MWYSQIAAEMAASSDQSSLLSSLECLGLKNVKSRDIQLGKGAYGSVFEVEHAGMIHAAKEIHQIFFHLETPQQLKRIKENFLQECRLWRKLSHPKIVTLIGVYFRDDDSTGMPIMVMEKMECSLRSLIEKKGDVKEIDMHTKLSMLHDVSLGVWHLHSQSPPIIHRDLTPNNILVRQGARGFEAKISDLGVSKVLRNSNRSIMSRVPGTPDFMAPETFVDHPMYGEAVDVFSYGGILLYAIVEEWPTPKARERVILGKTEIVSEVERRQYYLNKMTKFEDELKTLVESCLNDDPECRPKISKVSTKVEEAFKTSRPSTIQPKPPPHSPYLQVCLRNKQSIMPNKNSLEAVNCMM